MPGVRDLLSLQLVQNIGHVISTEWYYAVNTLLTNLRYGLRMPTEEGQSGVRGHSAPSGRGGACHSAHERDVFLLEREWQAGDGGPWLAAKSGARLHGCGFEAQWQRAAGPHPHAAAHVRDREAQRGSVVEDVSLLLAHHSIKITERHYLRFDQRRQERPTRVAMVDFEQARTPQLPKQRRGRVLEMPHANTASR